MECQEHDPQKIVKVLLSVKGYMDVAFDVLRDMSIRTFGHMCPSRLELLNLVECLKVFSNQLAHFVVVTSDKDLLVSQTSLSRPPENHWGNAVSTDESGTPSILGLAWMARNCCGDFGFAWKWSAFAESQAECFSWGYHPAAGARWLVLPSHSSLCFQTGLVDVDLWRCSVQLGDVAHWFWLRGRCQRAGKTERRLPHREEGFAPERGPRLPTQTGSECWSNSRKSFFPNGIS